MLGRVYTDDQGAVWGVVDQAVPGNTAFGTSASLDLDHSTWLKMLERAELVESRTDEEKPQLIGWYHSHPNQLDVFMSGVDRTAQRTMFPEDWHFAIVVNPHRQIWRAFHGADAIECIGVMTVD